MLLALIGFLLILITKQMRVPGYMIFSILITTLVGIPMGLTRMPEAFFMAPSSPFGQFMKIDFLGALQFAYLPFLIAMFVPDFFSTFGTALGVGAKAGFLDEDGNLPGIDKVFKVDAVATALGSLFCMPCMTTYLESSSGVEAGGKTGLTPISTSVCFAFTLLLTPFALMIPSAATAPALIIIGVGMLSSMRNINYDDFTESFPAFICVAFTIFANNIANGICVALPVYVVLKLASGKIKEMPKICMYCWEYACCTSTVSLNSLCKNAGLRHSARSFLQVASSPPPAGFRRQERRERSRQVPGIAGQFPAHTYHKAACHGRYDALAGGFFPVQGRQGGQACRRRVEGPGKHEDIVGVFNV